MALGCATLARRFTLQTLRSSEEIFLHLVVLLATPHDPDLSGCAPDASEPYWLDSVIKRTPQYQNQEDLLI